ncbi:MAG: TSUP family transporter [Bacteroidetes bacterium]|jgi:uncharacterized membrane protein YfcA|nr:TSUP family transporter [Bacteroidota bacterium]
MHELLSNFNFYFLLVAAFSAGFIDAIVGGGGLIQLPAFFLAFPSIAPAVILGSNKFASFSGTSVATVGYLRKRPVKWQAVLPAVITALVFSMIGAHLVSLFDKNLLKPFVLVLLILVAIYTFFKKELGLTQKKGVEGIQITIASLLAGALLGLYDGFFGPGTGSFLILIYISVFGFDFLDASVSAKVINCATNAAALCYFIYTGNIRFDLAIPVAICNMIGSFLGVRMALLKGSGFVRVLFLIVVSGMILKFAWDIFYK